MDAVDEPLIVALMVERSSLRKEIRKAQAEVQRLNRRVTDLETEMQVTNEVVDAREAAIDLLQCDKLGHIPAQLDSQCQLNRAAELKISKLRESLERKRLSRMRIIDARNAIEAELTDFVNDITRDYAISKSQLLSDLQTLQNLDTRTRHRQFAVRKATYENENRTRSIVGLRNASVEQTQAIKDGARAKISLLEKEKERFFDDFSQAKRAAVNQRHAEARPSAPASQGAVQQLSRSDNDEASKNSTRNSPSRAPCRVASAPIATSSEKDASHLIATAAVRDTFETLPAPAVPRITLRNPSQSNPTTESPLHDEKQPLSSRTLPTQHSAHRTPKSARPSTVVAFGSGITQKKRSVSSTEKARSTSSQNNGRERTPQRSPDTRSFQRTPSPKSSVGSLKSNVSQKAASIVHRDPSPHLGGVGSSGKQDSTVLSATALRSAVLRAPPVIMLTKGTHRFL